MAKQLTQSQRYYICLKIANNFSQASIAEELKVHRSTVCREIKRNQRSKNDYDSDYADKKAKLRRSQASSSRVFKKLSKRMKEYIYNKLTEKWSPEQIAGRMKIDLGKSISHETIYKYVRFDKHMGGNLFKLLPHRGKKYRYGSRNNSTIIDRVDISHRPKIVDKKIRIGDFEIDTVVSAKNTGRSCLLTMVDRKSKLTFIRKLKNKTALGVQKTLDDIYLNTIIPIHTITSDNGTEFTNHKTISQNIACTFYFARPYRSCERGLNEHTNGQIRRYLPKGTNFDTIPEDVIKKIENDLNNRPRKSLNYRTPKEVIDKYLQRVSHNHMRRKKASVAFHR